jgi:hypothetical protein
MANKATKHKGWSKRIERNILSVLSQATDQERDIGMFWYRDANSACQIIAERQEVPLPHVIGVVAALSPGNEWGRNLLDAERLIDGWKIDNVPMVGSYGMGNITKAIRILNGEIPMDVLGGNKTKSFYQNILDPEYIGVVTIDRHAKGLAIESRSNRGATADKDAIVTPGEYPWYAMHYVRLAERLGLIPNQLQAITWGVWKRLAESKG